MNLLDLKIYNFGIDKAKFGRIFSFIDFGNVDYWFERDERDAENNFLQENCKLAVSLEKLAAFSKLFSDSSRFYFGFDPDKSKSVGFMDKSRLFFDNTITKPVQKIKHYLDGEEAKTNTRKISRDQEGNFICIPKCNFDVEICIDAIRLIDNYDTFCLFSSDADFIRLFEFLRKKKKKSILIKGGFIQYGLKKAADLVISAQDIKPDITFIKQKSRR